MLYSLHECEKYLRGIVIVMSKIIKLLNKIKNFPLRKYLIFLLWHDNKVQPLTKYLLVTITTLIGTIWAYPLDNISPQGFLPDLYKFQLRIWLSIISVLLTLLSFIYLAIIRYKKYSKDNLTDEELDNFLHHMNESK